MPDLSPKATALINKYTPGEIAERCVTAEEQLDIAIAFHEGDKSPHAQLKAANAAQAQTIKAAHIRTAEISTRYNDCQRQVDGWQALCMFEGNSSLHLLKLIADNLLSSVTPTSVKRAQANWLRRFIKVAANLEGDDDEIE